MFETPTEYATVLMSGRCLKKQMHIPRSKTYGLDVGRRQVRETMRKKWVAEEAKTKRVFQKQTRTKKTRDQAFLL